MLMLLLVLLALFIITIYYIVYESIDAFAQPGQLTEA